MRVTDFGKAGADARAVLTGMIIGDRVCGAVAQKWSEEGLFDSQYLDRVGGWCVDHYRKYNKAPGKQILIYHRRYAAKKSRPDEESKAVDDLLGSMNEEYIRKEKKHLQSDYLIGLASDLFTAVMIRRKTERARDYADAGKLDKAVAELAQTDKVDMTSEEMTSILEDPEAVRASFEEQSEPLVVYPGAAGHFFKNRLKRRAFVAFEGPEKVGKSFWILDVAWRGMQQGRRVAYFECGDMPREEVVMRIAARACRRAVDPAETEDGVYQFPISIEPGESSTEVVHEDRRITQRMTHEEANRAFRKTTTKYGTDLFKLSCHSTKSLSVEGIHEILKRQKARYGWVPDIVCLASGSKVLTDRGEIPIEKVRRSDRLWDGVGWVSHAGLVYKGVQRVITYAGLTATPDHKVWTTKGWRTLESCRRLGLSIAQTGVNGKEIRLGRNFVAGGKNPFDTVPKTRTRLPNKAGVCFCRVCSVRSGEMGPASESQTRDQSRVSAMSSTEAFSNLALQTSLCGAAALLQPELGFVERLWGSRNKVQVPVGGGVLSVDFGQLARDDAQKRNRQDQQRRSLSAWESSGIHPQAELFPHQKKTTNSENAQVQDCLPVCEICGRQSFDIFQMGDDVRSDRRQVEGNEEEMRESEVWDVVNCGPFSRFTVQGLLVHNCVDYADIVAPSNGTADTRDQINHTWAMFRALAMNGNCLVVTATQANRGSYNADVIGMEHTGEDKRKASHVSLFVGINQNDAERDRGVYRLNTPFARSGKHDKRRCLTTAGCLAVANPCILSVY